MNARRFELDWLRVLVFGFLILYHVSMYFNPWGWHIKSPTTYGWMELPLLMLNQWRLEILFVISGMGTFFSLRKRSNRQYAWERIKRLYLPLAFGMLVIIPPQVYVERVVNEGMTLSYWEFLTNSAFQGIYPEGNMSWHHLWFLPYLLTYSLLLIPLLRFFRGNTFQRLLNTLQVSLKQNPLNIYFFILPIIFVEATLSPFFPVMPTLIGDWYAVTHYFLLFLFGFTFMHMSEYFFALCAQLKQKVLLIAAIAFGIQVLCFPYMSIKMVDILQSIFEIVYMWSIILAIFGYATRYLAHNSRYLKYLNEGVYPFYIFHQTVLIVAIFQFKTYFHSDLLFFSFLVLATLVGSWILFEGVRRINVLRTFFGLKGKFQGKEERIIRPNEGTADWRQMESVTK
ncbi:MAG: acyltransferase family protein [Bacteroidota bacterium]